MTFATTAANRLNMQAPELGKFVVAFKDLSDELPENTGVQCGMFVLNLAGKYIYIPVIAKAGNIQVLESMFDADTKTFIPITKKSVEWMIEEGYLLGNAERIPAHVARDPDLYDAIVPPKTGKFVYASEGRIGGFFASLPNHIKEATLNIVESDYELQEAMAKVMDIDIAKEHLLKESPEYIPPVGPAAPQVITSAEGLTQDQVQEIMSKGYTVINPPKSKKVAVEASSSQALTTLSSLPPGRAVMAMKKNGDWVGVASVRPVETYTAEHYKTSIRGEEGSSRSISGPSEPDVSFLAITEDGYLLTDPKVVVSPAEVKFDDVISRQKPKRLTEVGKGDYGMAFTGAAWYGPLTVSMVEKANGWTNINMCDCEHDPHTISIHPNIKTLYDFRGTDVLMSTSAMFYPLKKADDMTMEKDINMAQMKSDIALEKALPYQSTLMHRNGIYAVDGKEIGGKPQVVEHLLKEWEIDVPSIETFLSSAETKQNVIVKMAAVRQGGRASPGTGTKVQQHYQHGLQPGSDDAQLTGNARQRALGMAGKAKMVKDVADREVMEATIISEMIQNPDLSGTIDEYLPEIKMAVDKLGRSLFLMRLNTNKLSDKIDAEALNNLFTATRNAYRLLGENYIELQNLVANET